MNLQVQVIKRPGFTWPCPIWGWALVKLKCILPGSECWEYGTATGGGMLFTWLECDRKTVQRKK